jgi:hypothetical protein
VRLNDSRLMLTGDHAFMHRGGRGVGGAERLGFAQIASASTPRPAARTQSFRDYAIDAAQRGSVVNLGKADAPGGQITISGSIRALQRHQPVLRARPPTASRRWTSRPPA